MRDEFELAKAIHDGKLELLCTEMQLLRAPSYHDVLLEGTGVIRTNEDGRLSFQMVAPIKSWPSDPALNPHRPHGEVYEADDHVMLRAVDYHGREWRSDWFLAKPFSPASGSPNFVVGHELESLFHASERPHTEESEGWVYVPRQRRLPFNATTRATQTVGTREIETRWSSDHHVRQIGQAEVEFRLMERHWLVVRARQCTPVMPDWAGLICQALSFATATTVGPAVAVRRFNKRKDIGLFSGPFDRFRTTLPPPLVALWSKTADDFWTLIQCFVEWSQQHEAERSELFEELAGIRSGALGSIHTACLTLAVGIETLIGLLLKDEPVDEDQRDGIASVIQHVKDWDGDEKVRGRALGMLSQMLRTRAVDRLYAFAVRSGVPKSLVEAWKTLRNMRAHGGTTGDDQKLYDLYYAAVELLYRLVGSTIGYTGQITPMSKRGWDMDEWGFDVKTEAPGDGT